MQMDFDTASLDLSTESDDEEYDDEDLRAAFETDNPHLKKLFSMKEYGQAPAQRTHFAEGRLT